ncbi:MAG: hypothetical protein Q8920_04365 [Bacillota bacterium]|nr:hypothetical protein [Bacillota bacterium]
MSNAVKLYDHEQEEPREQLKAAMEKYHLSQVDIARQLNLSILVVKSYLDSGTAPYYVEKLVKEWLE